jgi:hypothetical protein
VFRAYDPDQDRLVAVKWFRLGLPPERTHRLVAELEQLIASDLTQPVLSTPLAAGIVDAAAYLAQDFVAGESVDLLIRQHGAMPPGEAVRITASLAGALDAAAEVRIVHGALHPRDVLVSADDVRLTGLGIAGALERAGSVAPFRRPYTAPERAAGAAAGDPRADVFSLAVLVHEWLWARRVAGIGSQAADAMTEVAGADLPMLRTVFSRALAEDPVNRFGTARQFADELAHALTYRARPAPVAPAPAEPRLPLEDAEDNKPREVETLPSDLGSIDLTLRGVGAPDELEATPPPPREHPVFVAPPVAVPSPERLAIDTPGRAAIDKTFPADSLSTAFEATRSAVWPLGLALVLGVALGFAAGYEVATWPRDLESAPAAAERSPAVVEAGGGSPTSEPPAPEAPGPMVEPAASARSSAETSASTAAVATIAPSVAITTPRAGSAPRAVARALAANPAAAGRILVRSTPAGARVLLDGQDRGSTPLTMREIAPGAHTLRLVLDGYIASEQRVIITAEQPAHSVILALTPGRQPSSMPPAGGNVQTHAAIVVESRPAGANVFLDGKLVGRTPLQMGEVAPGEHDIGLELDGYRRWSSSVRVAAGERGRVAASLDR